MYAAQGSSSATTFSVAACVVAGATCGPSCRRAAAAAHEADGRRVFVAAAVVGGAALCALLRDRLVPGFSREAVAAVAACALLLVLGILALRAWFLAVRAWFPSAFGRPVGRGAGAAAAAAAALPDPGAVRLFTPQEVDELAVSAGLIECADASPASSCGFKISKRLTLRVHESTVTAFARSA